MINPVRFPTSSPQALPEPAETRPNLAAADRVNPLPGGKWRTLRHSWRPTGRRGPLFARGQRAGTASRQTAPRPRKARPHRRPGNRRARRGCAGGGDRFRCRRADGSAGPLGPDHGWSRRLGPDRSGRTARAGPRLGPRTAGAGPPGRTTAWTGPPGTDHGLSRTTAWTGPPGPDHQGRAARIVRAGDCGRPGRRRMAGAAGAWRGGWRRRLTERRQTKPPVSRKSG